MSKAVIPRWHGDNYQARIFWANALNLLEPTSCVTEVTFEANGPKAFDDVVVKYDPAVPRGGPQRIVAEYHQVKWHVGYGDRFGHTNLIDPNFIGAQSVSLLQRLKQAKQTAPEAARFTLITTSRASDDDLLRLLISAHDHSLLTEKLFDRTTDRARMGKVRKLWREHLELKDDEALLSSPALICSGWRTVGCSGGGKDEHPKVARVA